MASGLGVALLNVVALCLLLLCLRYGIYRERNDELVWTVEYSATTVGFSFLNLENYISRHVWNQLVATGGVLVGGLTFVAFQLHVRHLRRPSDHRRRIRGRNPSLAAQSPTRRSNGEESLSLDGTFLFGLAASSLLASAAAVSALGMNLRPFSAASPIPQQRTPGLYNPTQVVPSTDMAAIVYQSSFLRTVGATGSRASMPAGSRSFAADHAIDGRPPRIGCADYPDLRTRGVGINPAGISKAHPLDRLPPGLTIYSLEGVTIGTNMNAVCRDETNFWNWTHERVTPLRYENAFVHLFEFTEHRTFQRLSIVQSDPAELGLRTWLEDIADEDPPRLRQMFAFSRISYEMGCTACVKDAVAIPSVRVIACQYSGEDIRHRVRVNGGSSPITFLEELGPVSELSQSDMRPAAQAISSVIGHDLRGRGDGGVLMAGMADGGLQDALQLSSKKVNLKRLLEEILTDAAQGYFSVWRQRTEWWSVPSNKETSDGRVTGLTLRVGGGGWFWVGVMGTLAILPLVALFRLARAWDRTGELLLLDIGSDDGLSEDEDQMAFIPRLAREGSSPPPYSDKSPDP